MRSFLGVAKNSVTTLWTCSGVAVAILPPQSEVRSEGTGHLTTDRGQKACQPFILIAGNEINACSRRRLPPLLCSVERTKVVAGEPSIAAQFVFRDAIERVEADKE